MKLEKIWKTLLGIGILLIIIVGCILVWSIFEKHPMLKKYIVTFAVSAFTLYLLYILGENLYNLINSWFDDKPPGLT